MLELAPERKPARASGVGELGWLMLRLEKSGSMYVMPVWGVELLPEEILGDWGASWCTVTAMEAVGD